jgi:hypothetical protein
VNDDQLFNQTKICRVLDGFLIDADRASNPLEKIFGKRDYIKRISATTDHIKLALRTIPEPFIETFLLVLVLYCTFTIFDVTNMVI